MLRLTGKFATRDVRGGDEEAVHSVVLRVLAEYGLSPDCCGTDSDLGDIVANYLDRGGAFRVVTDGRGRIVGCAGLYPLSAAEAEIRKMYLLPKVRGLGIGRKLLEELVAAARERHFRRVVLETASMLQEAESLYRSFGFVETVREHMSPRADRAYALDLATLPHRQASGEHAQ